MATVYKTFLDSDITSTRTLLHESIPVTGALTSGSYGGSTVALGSEPHIKAHSHGMFQEVHDYPYLSSSANHIFDIAVGYSAASALSSSANEQNAKKINMYTQMAQVLMGYDITGSVQRFDQDGNLGGADSGGKLDEAVFLNFSRLLVKDEVKKGSFSLNLGVNRAESIPHDDEDHFIDPHHVRLNVADTGADSSFFVNSPAGEYGILYASNSTGSALATPLGAHGCTGCTGGSNNVLPSPTFPVGLIFYQAGVAVLSGSAFQISASNFGSRPLTGLSWPSGNGLLVHNVHLSKSNGKSETLQALLTGSTMEEAANGFRNRIHSLSFNNTTELNSTVYFCRANHNEFNYSSNPTYLKNSKIQVKNTRTDAPRSYITTVGLYSADNELLAVAKLSEPIRKDPTNEVTLRVRLDY